MDANQREIRAAEPLTMVEIVFPSDLNPNGVMFGGKVVALMDKAASLCCMHWAHRPVVTASIDSIQFCAPIRQGQVVNATSRVCYVGRTSCIVKVVVTAEDVLTGDVFYCCEGFFSVVGMDAHGKPVVLPLLPLDTDEQKAAWAEGEAIRGAMLARKRQSGG